MLSKILAVFLIIYLLAGNAFAANPIGVTRVQQLYSNWCWAACCEMFGRVALPSSYPTQTQIVTNIHHLAPDIPGSYDRIMTSIPFATNKTPYYSTSFGFSSIKSSVDAGRPIMAIFKWSGGGSHSVVIDGYNSTGSTVRIIDPGSGCSTANYAYSMIVN